MENLDKQEILNFITENKDKLRHDFHITKIGLFGSFATGRQSLNSDIDIIIELENNIENIYELKQGLRKLIQNKFNRDVDIAREKYLKAYIKEQILKEVLYG